MSFIKNSLYLHPNSDLLAYFEFSGGFVVYFILFCIFQIQHYSIFQLILINILHLPFQYLNNYNTLFIVIWHFLRSLQILNLWTFSSIRCFVLNFTNVYIFCDASKISPPHVMYFIVKSVIWMFLYSIMVYLHELLIAFSRSLYWIILYFVSNRSMLRLTVI